MLANDSKGRLLANIVIDDNKRRRERDWPWRGGGGGGGREG